MLPDTKDTKTSIVSVGIKPKIKLGAPVPKSKFKPGGKSQFQSQLQSQSQTETTLTVFSKSKTKTNAELSIPLNAQYEILNDQSNSFTRKQDYYQLFVDRCFAQGKRPYMEDFNLVVRDPVSGIILFIVCDGHGVGTLAKQLPKQTANSILPLMVSAQTQELYIRESVTDDSKRKKLIHDHWLTVERQVKEAILEIDETLYELYTSNNRHEDVGGSTLVVLAMLPWLHRLVTINVGDSHLIISDKDGESQFNTFASKPSHIDEKKRIEDAGGWVSKDNRVNGILALSRAMGDWKLKIDPKTGKCHPCNGPVSSMPTVEVWIYDDNLKYICLLTDGITDVMNDNEILTFVDEMNTKQIRPAHALVHEAYSRKSGDNMTALILLFVPRVSSSATIPVNSKK